MFDKVIYDQFQFLGDVQKFWRDGRNVIFDCGGPLLSVTPLTAGMVRVRLAPNGKFEPRHSWDEAITRPDSEYTKESLFFAIMEPKDAVEITTELLTIRVHRNPCRVSFVDKQGRVLAEDASEKAFGWNPQTEQLMNYKVIAPQQYFYGFGERTSLLEKSARRFTNWTTDPAISNPDHGPAADRFYQSIPFILSMQYNVAASDKTTGSVGYGIYFNNTYRTILDTGVANAGYFGMEAEGGELDYYFMYGPTPAQVVERYTDLTGRMPLPPRWSLGYQQSRWSYYPESVIRELVKGFRSRNIPCDVIHFDIDYMNGYRVFTWSPERFPNPTGMLKDLAEQGIKAVTIIDPGVKYDPNNNYSVYDQAAASDYFIRKADGSVYHGYVWPDDSVFPDFSRPEVREWWGDLHKVLLDSGVKGIWNDMNEPAIATRPFSEGGGGLTEMPLDTPQGPENERTTHAELHNLYALLEDKATYEGLRKLQPDTRPFLLTRAGFAGIQKYSAIWTGDNTSVWEHLEMSLPQLANLGLSGVAFVGSDIGGFSGEATPELFARWMQVGAFYPFSRGHSSMGTSQKEPWMFGPETENIVRNILEWRYRLLPYYYTQFWNASRTGAPIWRPLFYQFPNDPGLAKLHDQVMVGDSLMLAPIYRPGQEFRHVYLPSGVWYNFWTNTYHRGVGHLLGHAPLDTVLLYGRGGTIVPLGPIMEWTDQKAIDKLTLKVFVDDNDTASGQLYEDDGSSFSYTQGGYSLTRYECRGNNGQYQLTAQREGGFQPAPRSVEVELYTRQGVRTANLDSDNGNWQVTL